MYIVLTLSFLCFHHDFLCKKCHALSSTSVYEAMESFSAENDDEVGFRAGERIHVIHKSMDGWWKIRYRPYVQYIVYLL